MVVVDVEPGGMRGKRPGGCGGGGGLSDMARGGKQGAGGRWREGLTRKRTKEKKQRRKKKKKKKRRMKKKKKKKGADPAAIYTRSGADRGKTPQFCCSILQTYI